MIQEDQQGRFPKLPALGLSATARILWKSTTNPPTRAMWRCGCSFSSIFLVPTNPVTVRACLRLQVGSRGCEPRNSPNSEAAAN